MMTVYNKVDETNIKNPSVEKLLEDAEEAEKEVNAHTEIEMKVRNARSLEELVKYVPEPVVLFNAKHFYDDITKRFGIVVSTKTNYRLFLCSFGKDPDSIFILFVKPDSKRPNANEKIFIRPLNRKLFEKHFISEGTIKPGIIKQLRKVLKLKGEIEIEIEYAPYPIIHIYKLKGKQKTKELVFSLPILEILDNIPEIYFRKIAKENWLRDIREKAIPQNDIDERLYWPYVSASINFSTKPDIRLMKYQPHIIYIAPTKIGKTTLAQFLFGPENVYTRATHSRLLGYATAEDEYPGDLLNKTTPTVLDEVNLKGYEQQFFDTLLNISEQGSATIGVGSKKLPIKCLSQLFFLTNTQKIDAAPTELLTDLESFLDKFTESPQRIGSRFLLILGNDFKQNPKITINEKHLTLLKFAYRKITKNIEILLRESVELNDLLDLPLDEKEAEIFKMLLSKVSAFGQRTIEFWQGFLEGFKHLNGLAFKIAMLRYTENHPEFLIDPYSIDIDEFEEEFRETRKEILSWFEKSLRVVIENLPEPDEYIKIKFETLAEYQRVFLKLVYLYINNHGYEGADKYTPIDLLEQYFAKLSPEEVKCVSGRFSDLKRRINKGYRSGSLQKALSVFGVEVFRIDNEDLGFVYRVDKSRFEILKKFLDMAWATEATQATTGENIVNTAQNNRKNGMKIPYIDDVAHVADVAYTDSKKSCKTDSDINNIVDDVFQIYGHSLVHIDEFISRGLSKEDIDKLCEQGVLHRNSPELFTIMKNPGDESVQ